MTNKLALEKAIDFIESLTRNPLIMGVDDIEMTLDDVQEHARIELASIRKALDASPQERANVDGLTRRLLDVLDNEEELSDEVLEAFKALDNAVSAHSPQAQMAGWQDISSAARDGSEVLVWNGRRRHVAHFDKIEGEWVSSFKTTTKRLMVTPSPTHWSPLPTEPATTEGQP